MSFESNNSLEPVEIEYFTDPLCSWSWAFEPQWRRLRFDLRGHVRWRYHMGGMIPDWRSYSDPINSVNRPAQMAPQWLEVRHLTGMPLDPQIWITDPPESSFPASVAFKAAEFQSADAAEHLLRRLREAVMLQGRNIARWEVIYQIADEFGREQPDIFNEAQFTADAQSAAAVAAFREDIKQARYLGIGRFPALTMQVGNRKSLLLVGCRPYTALLAAIRHIAPKLETPYAGAIDEALYQAYWPRLTDRELQEIRSPMAETRERNPTA